MPFTAAHPAIVLPLKKIFKDFYLPAAVIGSIAPDVEYFLRLETWSTLSHTWLGVFVFDLPVTLVVWLLYEYVVKASFIRHLPAPFDGRYNNEKPAPWRSVSFWLVFALSAIAGIVSHILWDGFTHVNGFFVKHLVVLQGVFNFFGHRLEVWKFLQHFCSLMGMACIAIVFWWSGQKSKEVVGQRVTAKQKMYFWLAWIVLSALFFGGFVVCFGDLTKYLGSLVVFIINSAALALFVICFADKKLKR